MEGKAFANLTLSEADLAAARPKQLLFDPKRAITPAQAAKWWQIWPSTSTNLVAISA